MVKDCISENRQTFLYRLRSTLQKRGKKNEYELHKYQGNMSKRLWELT